MAIHFMDNFSLYGTDESFLTNGVYATAGFATLVTDPDVNATGTVIQIGPTNSEDQPIRKVLLTARQTTGIACRMWMDDLPASSGMGPMIQFMDVNATPHITLSVRTTGQIFVTRGGFSGTVLGESSGPVLVANAWQHIEIKTKIHATLGTVEVRVDGVPKITLTGQNTANSGILTTAQVAFNGKATGLGASINAYIKDFITWDDQGSSNNDFLGTCQVVTLTPNGDNSFNWTASTGTTGYNLIDEAPPNDDTDYISADNTPPAASSFNLTNLPVDVTSVKGLMTMVRARKTDGGDGNVQVSMLSSASTANGADRPITVAYTYWMDVFETDPATSGAWTPVAVDASKIKINRTV